MDSSALVETQAGGAFDASGLRVNDFAAAGADTTLTRTDFTNQIEVAGTTTLSAGTDIILPREADGLHNVFTGEVDLTTGGDAIVETSGDLTLAGATIGADLILRTNADNAGGDGAVAQSGALDVTGSTLIITGDHGGDGIDVAVADVTLTDADNSFAGDVTVIGDNLSLTAASDLTLANSRIEGDATIDGDGLLRIEDAAIGGNANIASFDDMVVIRASVGGDLTTTSDGPGTQLIDLNVAGSVSVTADAFAQLVDTTVGDLTITAGLTATLTNVFAQSVSVDTGGVTISGLTATDVILDADFLDNDLEQVVADSLALTSGDGDTALRRIVISGDASIDAREDVTLADISVGNDLTIDAANINSEGAEGRVAVGGALALTTDDAIGLTDLAVTGASVITAGGDVVLDDLSLANLTLISDEATISDADADVVSITSTGQTTATNLRAGTLTVVAGDVTLGGVTVTGAADLAANVGDVLLRAVDVGQTLTIDAVSDVIVSGTGGVADAFTVAAAIAPAVPAFTVDQAAVAALGETLVLPASPGAETRVTDGVVVVDNIDVASPIVVQAADIDFAAVAFDDQLAVGAATVITAGTDVAITSGDFGDTLTIIAATDASLTDVTVVGDTSITAQTGAITLDTTTFDANLTVLADTDATFATVAAAGDLALTAGTAITSVDLTIGGNAVLDAGADATLTTTDVTGNVDATVGNNLTSTTLTVGGDTTLDVGADTALNTSDLTGGLTLDTVGDLLSDALTVGGDTALTSGADTTLTTSALTGDLALTAGAAITSVDLTVGGNAVLDAGTDATLTTTDVTGNVDATVGNNLTSTTLTVSGDTTLDVGADTALTTTDVTGNVVATVGNNLTSDDLTVGGTSTFDIGGDGTLDDSDLTGNVLLTVDGAIVATELDADGDVTVRGGDDSTFTDINIGGVLDVDTAGDLEFNDLLVVNELAVVAGGSISFDGLVLEQDAEIEAGDDINISGFSADGLTFDVGGDVNLSNGEAALLAIDAGGAVDLSNLRLEELAVQSGSTRVDAVRVVGDAAINAATDNIEIGALQVGGDLDAEAVGLIRTIDSDFELAAVPIVDANGVREIAAETLGSLIRVDGDATFVAGGDILLGDDAVGVTGDNEFAGEITARGVNIVINDATDITISAEGLTATGTGLLEAGGGISEVAGAVLTIDGDTLFVAGDDIILDNLDHELGGAIAAEAGGNIVLTEAGTIVLSEVTAGGDLSVIAGATGTTADAAITQVSASTVRDSEVTGETPDRVIAGPIIVDGDAAFSTGLDLALEVDDPTLTGDRSLTLGDNANIFGGDLSIARIAGDALIVEESGVNSIGADALDNGILFIRNFEVGGSSTLRTTDNVIFSGRLTAVDDADVVPRLFAVDEGDRRDQGDLTTAEADLRLFIRDGETFTVDTTGGGVLATGRDVRFDGAVDGVNDAPSEGSPNISLERENAGQININAGVDGEIRFRDFVGAASPLGNVRFRGGSLLTGLTFADETPQLGVVTPDNRFLFDPTDPNDFFFAGDMIVDVSNEFSAFVPADQAEQFVLNNNFFGVNLTGFTFGEELQAQTISVAGFLVNSRNRAQGLVPFGPRSSQFTFNDCVIGDVNDCSTLPTSEVPINVSVDLPLLFEIDEDELLELFTSFGNEELWGVPESFVSDIGAGPEGATTESEDDEDDGSNG